MTNHIHLLMTPGKAEAVSAVLQALGRRFVPYIDHSYQRTGTLWEGRFKANAVQEESYLLACHRYIELNPVRAAMVDKPEDYPWSSYGANALGEPNPLLTPHGLYLDLGTNSTDRQNAYRDLFSSHLDSEMLRDVRSCLQTGTPLGNDRFRRQIEQVLGVKVDYSSRGRPKKPMTQDTPGNDKMEPEIGKGICPLPPFFSITRLPEPLLLT